MYRAPNENRHQPREFNFMILYDFSSSFHKCLHRIAALHKEHQHIDINDRQIQREVSLSLISELAEYLSLYEAEYKEPILCMDDRSGKNVWRKDIYPMYKSNRTVYRNKQDKFNYTDVYEYYRKFTEVLAECGIKMITIERCEADDIILILGEYCIKNNIPCLILSPDKDFIQLHRTDNIKQYSWISNKFITPEDKTDLSSWEIEHVCLGDVTDGVPRVVDFTQYNPGVKNYLESKNIYMTPYEFSCTKYDHEEFAKYGGPFVKPRFGIATLKKRVSNGLENFLNENEAYKLNYLRNRQLVLTEGIPFKYKRQIISTYKHTQVPELNLERLCQVLDIDINSLPFYFTDKYINESNNIIQLLEQYS